MSFALTVVLAVIVAIVALFGVLKIVHWSTIRRQEAGRTGWIAGGATDGDASGSGFSDTGGGCGGGGGD